MALGIPVSLCVSLSRYSSSFPTSQKIGSIYADSNCLILSTLPMDRFVSLALYQYVFCFPTLSKLDFVHVSVGKEQVH